MRTFLLLAAVASPLFAAPVVNTLAPRGAQPGKPVTVVATGTGLTPTTRLVLPFKAAQKVLPEPKPNPALLRVELTVEAGVAPGVYPARLVNEDGTSKLLLFRVDDLPTGAEVEDNSTPDKAQKLTWPVAVEGQAAGGDVDWFRITARKGQRVTAEVEAARLGAGLLPLLRVCDAKLRPIASDDTQSLAGDVRVSFVAPADGDYLIELSDSRYRGESPAFYRLRIGTHEPAAEVFPLGGRDGEEVTFALGGGRTVKQKLRTDALLPGRMRLAVPGGWPALVAVGDQTERTITRKAGEEVDIATPIVVNARLERPGRRDRYRVGVTPGTRLRVAVEAETLGSRLDGVLRVLGDKDAVLAQADDVPLPALPGQQPLTTLDPSLELTVPPGLKTLTVEVADRTEGGGAGYGYRLHVGPAAEDFSVVLPVTELNVPRGGAVALQVPIARRGYTGPVRLTAPKLPPGYRFSGGGVGQGGNTAVIAIAADDTPGEPADLGIEATGGPLRRPARAQLVLNRNVGAAGLLEVGGLVLAKSAAVPFQLAIAGPVTLVKGYPADVPVRVTRGKGGEKLSVALTPLVPAGVTANPVPATTGNEAKLVLRTATTAAEGEADVAVTGRAGAFTQASAAVPVRVVPPFVAMLAPRPAFTAGATVKWPGKVARQAVFKEPVRVTVAGLPAGVTFAAKAITGDDFVLELAVAKTYKPGAAPLTVTFAATVMGQNYTASPLAVP